MVYPANPNTQKTVKNKLIQVGRDFRGTCTKAARFMAIPATGILLTGTVRADDFSTPVVTAISGLAVGVTAIIAASLVIGMLVVGGKLAFRTAKGFFGG